MLWRGIPHPTLGFCGGEAYKGLIGVCVAGGATGLPRVFPSSVLADTGDTSLKHLNGVFVPSSLAGWLHGSLPPTPHTHVCVCVRCYYCSATALPLSLPVVSESSRAEAETSLPSLRLPKMARLVREMKGGKSEEDSIDLG